MLPHTDRVGAVVGASVRTNVGGRNVGAVVGGAVVGENVGASVGGIVGGAAWEQMQTCQMSESQGVRLQRQRHC